MLMNFLLAVSLFQDFREMATRNSNRRFRPRLAQLEARVLFSKNRETVQQRPISTTKAKSCLFQPVLKQRETVRNSQHITAGRPKVTIMTKSTFAPALRKQIRNLLAAGGQISREGATLVVDGPPQVADTLRAEADRLATSIVPSVTADDAALVRSLLDDAGVSVAYITDPAAARNAVG